MKIILRFLKFLLRFIIRTYHPEFKKYEYAFFTMWGQDNCCGFGNSKLSPPCTEGLEIKASLDIITRIQDPVGLDYKNFNKAKTGSAWPAFAQKYYELTGQRPIILVLGVHKSGLNCEYEPSWLRGIYRSAKEITMSSIKILEHNKYNFTFKGMIWWQGETDANLRSSIWKYKSDLSTLYHHFFFDFRNFKECKIYIARPRNICFYREVRKAQELFVFDLQPKHNVYMAFENDFDNFSYLTQDQYNYAGKTIAKNIVKKIIFKDK